MAQNSYVTVGAINNMYEDIYKRIQGIGGMWDIKGDIGFTALLAATSGNHANGDVWNINSIEGMDPTILDVKVGSNLACVQTYSAKALDNNPSSNNYWRNYWMVVSGMFDIATTSKAGMIKLGVTDETSTTNTALVRAVTLNNANQAHVSIPIASATQYGLIAATTNSVSGPVQVLQGHKQINGNLDVTGTITGAQIEGAANEIKVHPIPTTPYGDYAIAIRQGQDTTDSQGRLTHKIYNKSDFRYQDNLNGFKISGGSTASKSAEVYTNFKASGTGDISLTNSNQGEASIALTGASTLKASTVSETNVTGTSASIAISSSSNSATISGTHTVNAGAGLTLTNSSTSAKTLIVGANANIAAPLTIGDTLAGPVTIKSNGVTSTTIVGPAGGTIKLPANSSTNNVVMVQATAGTSDWLVYSSANDNSTIVKRDTSGNFSAGTITANIDGTADKATKLMYANTTGASDYITAQYDSTGNRVRLDASHDVIVDAADKVSTSAVDSGTHYLLVSSTNASTTGGVVNVKSNLDVRTVTQEFSIHKKTTSGSTTVDTYLDVHGGGTYFEGPVNTLMSIINKGTQSTGLYLENTSTTNYVTQITATTDSTKISRKIVGQSSEYNSLVMKGHSVVDASSTTTGVVISNTQTTPSKITAKGTNSLETASASNVTITGNAGLEIKNENAATTTASLTVGRNVSLSGGTAGLNINNYISGTTATLQLQGNTNILNKNTSALGIRNISQITNLVVDGGIRAQHTSSNGITISGLDTNDTVALPLFRVEGGSGIYGYNSTTAGSANNITLYSRNTTTQTEVLRVDNKVSLTGSTSSTTGNLQIYHQGSSSASITIYDKSAVIYSDLRVGSSSETGQVTIRSSSTSATTIIGPNNATINLPSNPSTAVASRSYVWSSDVDANKNLSSSMKQLVSTWSTTVLDTRIPSEKLVKDSLDGCVNILSDETQVIASTGSATPLSLSGSDTASSFLEFGNAAGTTLGSLGIARVSGVIHPVYRDTGENTTALSLVTDLPTITTCTVNASAWGSSTTATISVSGMTASANVMIAPVGASTAEANAYGVYCSAQGSNSLTFTCAVKPLHDLTFNLWFKK